MYKVRLDNFEGPLDLLLFFIKRDELDIYDIPISYITNEFMKYVEIMEQLDLEAAGEFILMAATLMQIKAKMLLPKERDEKGEEIDPRADLIAALLEYKRYKEMAEELSISESYARNISFRGNFEADEKESQDDLNSLLKNVTLYDLMKALKRALENRPQEAVHQIERVTVTIDEQINYILKLLESSGELSFVDLISGIFEKIKIIVTFIALLEMVKMGQIGLKESENFNDFTIYKLVENG